KRADWSRGMAENRVWLQIDQLFGKCSDLACVTAGPANLDPEVAALVPAQPGERIPERCDFGLRQRIALRIPHENADQPVRSARCTRGERPRNRRGAEQSQ